MNRTAFHRILTAAAILLAAAMLLAVASSASAQVGVSRVTLQLTVTNNHGMSVPLLAGLSEQATNGLDAALGEYELPPVPPGEIFDARLVPSSAAITLGEGSPVDYRPWRSSPTVFTEIYRIAYQSGNAAPSVTVLLPATVSSLITQVKIGARVVSGGDSVVSTASSGTMTVMVDYDLQPVTFALSPQTLTFALDPGDTAPPPARQVTVTPSVTGASWMAESDDGWITVDPARGAGSGSVTIGLGNLSFVGGRTTGTVKVFNARDDEPAVITVHVDMLTGVETPAGAAASVSAGVYPNPWRSAAGAVTIDVALPVAGRVSAAISDVLGRHVATLCEGLPMDAGRHLLHWSGAGGNPAPGTYFCRIATAAGTVTRMILVDR